MGGEFGYTGKILRLDLSSGNMTEVSTLDYADRFLGGRGIAAKIYWDEVPPSISAFHPENRLILATGPLGGLPVLGGSRWQVCAKSPIMEQFCYSNLGGRWGAELKFAGYDAIVVQGKSDKPVYLFLHDDKAELKDASVLWGKGAIETRETLKGELGSSARVVAIGPAGENMAVMASLLADNDASGSGGMGAVMGSKKLKAIVVKGVGKAVKVAQPERLRELTRYFQEVVPGFGMLWAKQFRLTRYQTKTKRDPCYGCRDKCGRVVYEAEDGQKGKFACRPSHFYERWGEAYYGEWTDVIFHAARLCNDYGLDVMATDVLMNWLHRCYEAGILTDDNTGIPVSKLGSLEFIQTLVRKVSLRDGFGDILAQGVIKAADWVGPEARKQIDNYLSFKGGQGLGDHDIYSPRLYITTALLHAMEQRPPIQQLHEAAVPSGKWVNWAEKIEGAYVSDDVVRAIARRFWGSELAADYSTYEGKALSAKMIQDRENAKECLILCDWLWPIMWIKHSQDHVGDPTLESKILSAVTGNEVDEQGLYRIGERVFNLQRAILVREGRQGRADDTLPDIWHTKPLEGDVENPKCLMPGKAGEIISRKGAVIDREEFEKMKDEYYQLREWDVTSGLQTKRKLEELELQDVAEELMPRGLVV